MQFDVKNKDIKNELIFTFNTYNIEQYNVTSCRTQKAFNILMLKMEKILECSFIISQENKVKNSLGYLIGKYV